MKIIAVGAIPMRARTLFLLIPVILTGCALPLPDKPVRPEPYDLGPALAAPAATPAGAPLALDGVLDQRLARDLADQVLAGDAGLEVLVELGLRLGDLAHQFALALFQVDHCLVAHFLCLMQGLGKAVHLGQVSAGHTGKAVQQPMCEPAHGIGQKQDDGGCNDEFGAVHAFGPCLSRRPGRGAPPH